MISDKIKIALLKAAPKLSHIDLIELVIEECQKAQKANERSEVEPVAWLWKHVNRDGEEVTAGLSFAKVDPTDNAFFMRSDDPRRVATEVEPLYTSPPQRKPLTDEEIRKVKHHMVDGAYQYSFIQGVRYAEAAHGITGEQK